MTEQWKSEGTKALEEELVEMLKAHGAEGPNQDYLWKKLQESEQADLIAERIAEYVKSHKWITRELRGKR